MENKTSSKIKNTFTKYLENEKNMVNNNFKLEKKLEQIRLSLHMKTKHKIF